MNNKRVKRIFLFASIILFAVSLTQKCYCTTGTCSDSFIVFILGIFGLLYPGVNWTWLANPLLLGAWIFIFRNPKISLLLSFSSTFLAAIFLMFGEILENENGQYRQIIAYKAGYWLWLASHVCMLIINVWSQRISSLSLRHSTM